MKERRRRWASVIISKEGKLSNPRFHNIKLTSSIGSDALNGSIDYFDKYASDILAFNCDLAIFADSEYLPIGTSEWTPLMASVIDLIEMNFFPRNEESKKPDINLNRIWGIVKDQRIRSKLQSWNVLRLKYWWGGYSKMPLWVDCKWWE